MTVYTIPIRRSDRPGVDRVCIRGAASRSEAEAFVRQCYPAQFAGFAYRRSSKDTAP